METLQEQIEAKVFESFSLALEKLKFNMTFYSVVYELKGKVAGTAKANGMILDFNLILAEKNTEEFLNQVVPHEVAHLVDFLVYQNWGHGKTWKRIMQYVFRIPADRCHQIDTSHCKTKKFHTFLYTCNCQEHNIKKVTHDKMSATPLKLLVSCADCKSRLVFKSYQGKI